MDSNDEIAGTMIETGSDELLADDKLRLPESANILVRLHAVRAWLARRYAETALEMGEAALVLQGIGMLAQAEPRRMRRCEERQSRQKRIAQMQRALSEDRLRLDTYEEAQLLLEDCVAHTGGERVLVEYYLILDELLQVACQEILEQQLPRLRVLVDVQHRIEHVGMPGEGD